jgi:ATP-dependent DNA helicase RecG
VTLHGTIQDPEFLRFPEEIGQELVASFDTADFLVIDLVHREQPVPERLKPRLQYLFEQGVIERVGRGRGVRHLLSQRFYRFLGQPGVYTRKRGLDRETNKALLLKHLMDNPEGSPMADLQQVLPSLSRDRLKRLMGELQREGRTRVVGSRRWARWVAT